MGTCGECIVDTGEGAKAREDFWEGSSGQEGLRVSRAGTRSGATAVGIHWKLLIRKEREVLICLLGKPLCLLSDQSISRRFSSGSARQHLPPSSQGPNDKPKFYFIKVHPGEPMSLVILFTEQWVRGYGQESGCL